GGRVVAAGVAAPGGSGAGPGVPVGRDRPLPPAWKGGAPAPARQGSVPAPAWAGLVRPPAMEGPVPPPAMEGPVPPPAVAMVLAGFGYARAAERLRALLAAGVPIGAGLGGSDAGGLIFNPL